MRLGLLSEEEVWDLLADIARNGCIDFRTLPITAEQLIAITGPHPYLIRRFLSEVHQDPKVLRCPEKILRPFFQLCWQWLTDAERETLMDLVLGQQIPKDDVLCKLETIGLVRPDGQILGTACAAFVRRCHPTIPCLTYRLLLSFGHEW